MVEYSGHESSQMTGVAYLLKVRIRSVVEHEESDSENPGRYRKGDGENKDFLLWKFSDEEPQQGRDSVACPEHRPIIKIGIRLNHASEHCPEEKDSKEDLRSENLLDLATEEVKPQRI